MHAQKNNVARGRRAGVAVSAFFSGVPLAYPAERLNYSSVSKTARHYHGSLAKSCE